VSREREILISLFLLTPVNNCFSLASPLYLFSVIISPSFFKPLFFLSFSLGDPPECQTANLPVLRFFFLLPALFRSSFSHSAVYFFLFAMDLQSLWKAGRVEGERDMDCLRLSGKQRNRGVERTRIFDGIPIGREGEQRAGRKGSRQGALRVNYEGHLEPSFVFVCVTFLWLFLFFRSLCSPVCLTA